MNLLLYGPPGVGKSSVGRALAAQLQRAFVDSDAVIEARAGLSIARLFAEQGEAAFRALEAAVCAELAAQDNLVVALGGGALVNPANRAMVERTGVIFCLRADEATLLKRLKAGDTRPLLNGDDPSEKLRALLHTRRALYDSFPEQVDTQHHTLEEVVASILIAVAPRELTGFQHPVEIGYGVLAQLPARMAARGLRPAVMVTDENIAPLLPAWEVPRIVIPAGEQHKTLATVEHVYAEFLRLGLDRQSVVVAVGGGVVGDLTGFAAATFMRGVRWVNVPTTLLAMVDASLGGKTGVDLPQGKNLVGAFHPPALVLSDPLLLRALPRADYIAGLGEVIKHGLIGDADLFALFEAGATFGSSAHIAQTMLVKLRVVQQDPHERGVRAILNAGHTIGHGVELASGFALRHGEAVAIGLAAETRLAERLGLAEPGLAERVEAVLTRVGLPVRCPGLSVDSIRAAMQADKKNVARELKFALPRRVGEAVWGVTIAEDWVMEELQGLVE